MLNENGKITFYKAHKNFARKTLLIIFAVYFQVEKWRAQNTNKQTK